MWFHLYFPWILKWSEISGGWFFIFRDPQLIRRLLWINVYFTCTAVVHIVVDRFATHRLFIDWDEIAADLCTRGTDYKTHKNRRQPLISSRGQTLISSRQQTLMSRRRQSQISDRCQSVISADDCHWSVAVDSQWSVADEGHWSVADDSQSLITRALMKLWNTE